MESSSRFHQSNLPSACFAVFRTMKKEGRLCDITIKFGSHSIFAHRLVLAAAIPYFKDMFNSPDAGGHMMERIVREIDPRALEALIDFAYSCKVEITRDNVKALLYASWILKIEDIREACCDFLGKRLNPRNVLSVRDMAENFSCSSLVEKSNTYIYDNFDEVAQTEEFLNAPFYFVKKVLTSNDLKTSSEEKVFQSVMRWVKKSPEDRKIALPELLSKVRLTLLSPDYLMDHVLTERYIRESIPCRDLLDKIKFYHLLPHRSVEFSSLRALPRPLVQRKDNRSAVAGIYTMCKEVRHKLLHLDSETGKWRTIETMPFTQLGTVAGHNDNLYFIDYDSVRIYTLPNIECETGGNYCPARISVGAAVLNNKLYVCGGQHRQSALRKVEYFDLGTQKSKNVTPMTLARSLLGVAALGDYLYAIGGGNEVCVHDSVERYDPRSDQWENLPPMNTKRYGMGCTTMDGKIYVSGGMTSLAKRKCLSSAEVYDPLDNEWKRLSPMNTPRYYCSLVAYCGKLYALGGYDDRGVYLNSVEIYSPRTDEWKFGCPMESSHTNVRAVAIPSSD